MTFNWRQVVVRKQPVYSLVLFICWTLALCAILYVQGVVAIGSVLWLLVAGMLWCIGFCLWALWWHGSLQTGASTDDELDGTTGLSVKTPIPATVANEPGAEPDEAQQRLEELEAERQLMTAGISHDLRAPLTRIRMAVSLLVTTPQATKQLADDMIEDIYRIDRIIQQYIDFAAYRKEPSQSHDFSANLLQCVMSVPSYVNCVICLDFEIQEHRVAIGEITMARVITNLIDNASKYGGGKLSIAIEQCHLSQMLFCTFRDFGQGLTVSSPDCLFTPFQREDTARGVSGSGLGLSICRKLLHDAGGAIQMTNHSEQGTVISFQVPLSVT